MFILKRVRGRGKSTKTWAPIFGLLSFQDGVTKSFTFVFTKPKQRNGKNKIQVAVSHHVAVGGGFFHELQHDLCKQSVSCKVGHDRYKWSYFHPINGRKYMGFPGVITLLAGVDFTPVIISWPVNLPPCKVPP